MTSAKSLATKEQLNSAVAVSSRLNLQMPGSIGGIPPRNIVPFRLKPSCFEIVCRACLKYEDCSEVFRFHFVLIRNGYFDSLLDEVTNFTGDLNLISLHRKIWLCNASRETKQRLSVGQMQGSASRKTIQIDPQIVAAIINSYTVTRAPPTENFSFENSVVSLIAGQVSG